MSGRKKTLLGKPLGLLASPRAKSLSEIVQYVVLCFLSVPVSDIDVRVYPSFQNETAGHNVVIRYV